MADFDPPTFSDRSHYRSYFASNKLRLFSFLFWQTILVLFLSCLAWSLGQLIPNPNILGLPIQLPTHQQILFITTVVSIVFFYIWPLVFGKLHWYIGLQNHRISLPCYKRLKKVIKISTILLIIFILLMFILSSLIPFIVYPFVRDLTLVLMAITAAVGISAYIFFTQSKPFLYKQKAILRNIWRYARQDRIRSEYSPIGDIVHPINRLNRTIQNFSTIHNPYAILILSFLIGGLIIPTWQVIGDSERNFHITLSKPFDISLFLKECIYSIFLIFEKFIPDSITYIGLIFGFSIGLSLFLRRQRYIISPFTTPDQQNQDAKKLEEQKDLEHLRSAAQHLTQEFIDQLEQLGALLTTRQVEKPQSSKRLPINEFITSGAENDFLEAIQSLVDLEERPKNLAGRLLTSLIKLLAAITITGTLRRRDQTTVELEVRLSQRFGNQTSIIVPIISSHGTEELLDDLTAASVARTAALRLLLRAGAVSQLASSEESIDAFLDGLAASAAHNWWRAAQSYQQAIHYEEAIRGSFGVGRYHLGVALLRQGELEAGYQNLVQAERAGKPMAEIHYMLAVVLLHKHWNNLDQQETDFHQIIRYGRLAMRHRRIFPEAYHLVGAAYYHRGKLLDRAATRTYTAQTNAPFLTTIPASARLEYDKAITQLHKAVRHYAHRIRRLQESAAPNPILREELDNLQRDRMTATHQLGDALRSAGCYALAETYYEDVLAAYPNNRRTLIDLAKTFILSKNWQRADEFLSREVQIFPEGKWNPDITFHLAWTYAGGVNERIKSNKKLLTRKYLWLVDRIIDLYKVLTDSVTYTETPYPKEDHLLLGRAVSLLDYALHQRARFIASWRQTNWQEEFVNAFQHFNPQGVALNEATKPTPQSVPPYEATKPPPQGVGVDEEVKPTPQVGAPNDATQPTPHDGVLNEEAKPTPHDGVPNEEAKPQQEGLYEKTIQNPDKTLISDYVMHLRMWLAWRLHQNASDSASKLINDVSLPSFTSDDSSSIYPWQDIKIHYQEWMFLRDKMVKLLKDIENTGRLHGMTNAQKRLQLAALALDNWKLASSAMRKLRKKYEKTKPVSFGARWAHDVYAEISLLTVRLLAEARAYEIAWVVALCSEYAVAWCMEKWINFWHSASQDPSSKIEFKFSPYIARYQLATLQAWKAWCANRLEQTESAQARLVVGKGRFIGIDKNAFDDLLSTPEIGINKSAFDALLSTPEIKDKLGLSIDKDGAQNDSDSSSATSAYNRARILIKLSSQFIDKDIRSALLQAPRHPLALWVQAQRVRAAFQLQEQFKEDRRSSMWVQAQQIRATFQPDQILSELQRLIEVLGPYDPNQSIANWHLVEKKQPILASRTTNTTPPSQDKQSNNSSYKTTRERFRKFERVSGRHQFSTIVNLYAANEQLAAVFADAGDYNLSIEHLMLALTQSPHWDFGADNLLLVLVQYLDQMDRLQDAYSVVATLRASRQVLETNSLSIAKLYQPYMWECIILTRMRRYAESFTAGEELQKRLNTIFENFQTKEPSMYINRLKTTSEDDLNTLFTYVWDLFKEKEGLTTISSTANPSNPIEGGESATASITAQLSNTHIEKSKINHKLSLPDQLVRLLDWPAELAKVLPVLVMDNTSMPPNTLSNLDVIKTEKSFDPVSSEGSKIGTMDHELIINSYPRLDINRNIALSLLDFLGEEALAFIELQAQLWNNRAYNIIELRLRHNPNKPTGSTATTDDLEDPKELVTNAINALEALLEHSFLSPSQRSRLHHELAYYLDTKAWMFYRLARLDLSDKPNTEKLLKNAQDSIDQALKHDQSSAVIYYHAARINLMRLERLWRTSVQSNQPIPPSYDNYLVSVHHYWTQARSYDHRGRFRSELAWIGLRLAEYRELWKTHLRQQNST